MHFCMCRGHDSALHRLLRALLLRPLSHRHGRVKRSFKRPLPVATSLQLAARHDQNGGPELGSGLLRPFSITFKAFQLMFVGLKPDMIESEVNVFNLMHGLAKEVGEGEVTSLIGFVMLAPKTSESK